MSASCASSYQRCGKEALEPHAARLSRRLKVDLSHSKKDLIRSMMANANKQAKQPQQGCRRMHCLDETRMQVWQLQANLIKTTCMSCKLHMVA